MSIGTVDDIAAGLAAAQHRNFIKNFFTANAAGNLESGWMATGMPAAGLASPVYTNGSGYNCDKTTAGAFSYNNASVQNYLAAMIASSSQQGTLILADRLWSCSGMGFAASTYSVTTPGNLPARVTDSGASAEIYAEQFATAGAASGTLTVNYLDSAGGAQSGVIAAVTSAPKQGLFQAVPLANNLGISQLTSVTNSATWTSASWGMTILRRYAECPMGTIGVAQAMDWAALALAKLPSDACLMLIYHAQTTTAATVVGSFDIIDK